MIVAPVVAAAAFTVTTLVSDRPGRARTHDRALVNAWGLAATPTGPWWVANQARNKSTLYAGNGRKQALTVDVQCGPTGVAAYTGRGFVVREGSASGPARFVYACEDGTIRAWSPTVPDGWSHTAVVAIDYGLQGSIFKGVAFAGDRLYVADFHRDRVLVFDSKWRRLPLRFIDRTIPAWYQPFNLIVAAGHLFVAYASPAPVDGNDAPKGGYIDEFDLNGRLIARLRSDRFNEPWGLALAPGGFGPFGGDLIVANFGTGHVDAYRPVHGGWRYHGRVATVPGVWGIAFGNGAMAGPRTSLFFAGGPHRWLGASELNVHGAFGAITPRKESGG